MLQKVQGIVSRYPFDGWKMKYKGRESPGRINESGAAATTEKMS